MIGAKTKRGYAESVTALGRVLDPEDLHDDAGPRGRLAVDVPASWLADAAVVEVVVPTMLACARCEGGGCDGCSRSGGLRLTGDATARTLQLTLPRPASDAGRLQLRLVRPLGDDAGLDQLLIELRSAAAPSTFCRRVASATPGGLIAPRTYVIGAVLVGLLAIVAALLGNR